MGRNKIFQCWNVILFFFLCLLSVLIISLVSFLVIKGRNSPGMDDPQTIHSYQSLSYNSETKEILFGTIDTYREIDSEENRFYQDYNGLFNLISPLGSDEYVCTGSCFCINNSEEEEKRRSSSSVQPLKLATRSVTYLVSGVTSVIALDRAKTYFQEECDSHKDEICNERQSSRVFSEVLECKEAAEIDTYSNGEKNEASDFFYRYLCEGECNLRPSLYKIWNEHSDDIEDDLLGEYGFFPEDGTEEFKNLMRDKRFGKKYIEFKDLGDKLWECTDKVLEMDIDVDLTPEDNTKTMYNKAKKKFKEKMNPFCISQSLVTDDEIKIFENKQTENMKFWEKDEITDAKEFFTDNFPKKDPSWCVAPELKRISCRKTKKVDRCN